MPWPRSGWSGCKAPPCSERSDGIVLRETEEPPGCRRCQHPPHLTARAPPHLGVRLGTLLRASDVGYRDARGDRARYRRLPAPLDRMSSASTHGSGTAADLFRIVSSSEIVDIRFYHPRTSRKSRKSSPSRTRTGRTASSEYQSPYSNCSGSCVPGFGHPALACVAVFLITRITPHLKKGSSLRW